MARIVQEFGLDVVVLMTEVLIVVVEHAGMILFMNHVPTSFTGFTHSVTAIEIPARFGVQKCQISP